MVDLAEMQEFLEFAAVFLANVGNYYGTGDQKFIPRVSDMFLKKISSVSSLASQLYDVITEPMLARRPSNLGFPSDIVQSSYYPGAARLSRQEIARVSRILEDSSIYAENTRIRKVYKDDGKTRFEVMQGSIERDDHPRELDDLVSGIPILVIRGDHSKELSK
ncbi:MAG: hypothetical protein M1830_010153, partial [Pleopsidium flavum]